MAVEPIVGEVSSMSNIKCTNCGTLNSPENCRHCGYIFTETPVITSPDELKTDEDVDELERLGNRAMEFLVAKYGQPQSGKFVNWQARPEEIALEMAYFVQRITAEENG